MTYPFEPGRDYPQNPGGNVPPPPPGYPAQPQGYPYAGYPPYPPYGYPPPQRRNNTTLWVILGIVGFVIIGVCIACAVLIGSLGGIATSVSQQYVQPLLAAQTFCDDEMHANYGGAYDLFSPTIQATITRSEYISQSNARDETEGRVTSCDVDFSSSDGFSGSTTQRTLDVNMTRNTAGDFSGTMTVVSQNSGQNATWQIDSVDPNLPILTDGTPLDGTPSGGTTTPAGTGTATAAP